MNTKRTWIAGIILVLILAGGIYYLKQRQAGTLSSFSVGNVKAEHRSKGPTSAPIQIIEYSDFQCPACQRSQPILEKLFATFPDQIHLEFRHFPLEGHIWSGLAHQTAECAGRQGQFWAYHDKLFQGQQSWATPTNPAETFIRYAKELNLDMNTFAACITDSSVTEDIRKVRAMGEKIQVASTPTFLVNQERIVGPVELMTRAEKIIRAKLGLPEPVTPPDAVASNINPPATVPQK